jgi:hypothetical protein
MREVSGASMSSGPTNDPSASAAQAASDLRSPVSPPLLQTQHYTTTSVSSVTTNSPSAAHLTTVPINPDTAKDVDCFVGSNPSSGLTHENVTSEMASYRQESLQEGSSGLSCRSEENIQNTIATVHEPQSQHEATMSDQQQVRIGDYLRVM